MRVQNFAYLLLFIFISECTGIAGELSRPNIILLIADDMNWDDCGVYGHPSIRTPHIDRLAEQGMRFEQAFVTASSCSPSRASIITGRYPHATDAEQLHWPVPADQVTFVEKLKDAGYWTAAAGKWHLGPALENRFDEVRPADTSGFQLPSNDADPGSMKAAKDKASGCEEWIPVLKDRPQDQPFFCWFAALDPHRDYDTDIIDNPHQPSDVRLPPYHPDVPDVRKDYTQYYDEITRLDDYVGKVMHELEEQGVAENTLIIFFSDNGRPFPRDKTTLYDGGIRTPFILHWPAKIKAGQVCEELVSTVDIAPTCLEVAGLQSLKTFQGKSFAGLIDDPATQFRNYIYAEDHWHDFEDHARAVRSQRYKYIRNDYPDLPNTPSADAGRSLTFQAMLKLKENGQLNEHQLACFVTPRPTIEFYDLKNDPFELQNLADNPKYAKAIAEHAAALEGIAKQTGDKLPKQRTPDEFDRITGKPTSARIRPRPSKAEMFPEGYR
ncbi:sulfatase family protein [Calycomorphotria hydatis]|uniref:Arylsulfatase n=1 Tax=Calycomorphotria hydatis TaxID=2528027 RepID=A0A517TAF3_9PLAN|nr:sulfatase [Calycomorphotria hydatis]QDT65349.1 Arylsulfatase precursor [Calycomorphotria hydatis]